MLSLLPKVGGVKEEEEEEKSPSEDPHSARGVGKRDYGL